MRVLRRKGEQRNSPANGWAPQFPPSANDGLAIADVWACVRVLAGSAASLPLVPYRRQGEGRVRLTSGRLYELLQTPSWATTQANLIGQGMSHLLLHGNAYLGKFRGGDGRLEQLSLLDPLNVSVELVAGSPATRSPTRRPGGSRTTAPTTSCRSAALSTDGLVGLSPLKSCRLAVDYARGMSESAAALTKNGFLPAGIVTVPGGLSEESINKLAEGFAGKHGAARNMHRVAVLSGS